jgi:hypothetical protein
VAGKPARPADANPAAALRPPDGLVLLFRARAEGFQIYECKPRLDKPGAFAWVLKAPQADLFDDHGQKLGAHYAGPTWEALDGSKVRAAKKKEQAAPDANAVAWLLLQVTGHEGDGRLSKVKYIQRVDTWAGKAPAACDRADEGKEKRVKYQATYLFFGDKLRAEP